MVLLQRKLYFTKDPEGSDISQGGVGGGGEYVKNMALYFATISQSTCCWTLPGPMIILEQWTDQLSYCIILVWKGAVTD